MVRNLSMFNGCVMLVCLLTVAFAAVAQECDPDETPPEITIPGPDPLVVDCGMPVSLPEASGVDACDGPVSVSVSDLDGLDEGAPTKGTYTVTFSATDAAGNSSDETLDVQVVDSLPPVVSRCATSSAVEVDEIGSFNVPDLTGTVVVADACDAFGDLTITQSPPAGELVVASVVPSQYPIDITITDSESNSTVCTYYLNLINATMPVIVPRLYDDLGYELDPMSGLFIPKYETYWECGVPYDDGGAIAFDSVDGDLTASIVTVGAYAIEETNLGGNYEVVYTVTNSRGIEAQLTRYVTVVDRARPAISLVALEDNRSGSTEIEFSYEDSVDPELKDPEWLWELKESDEQPAWLNDLPDSFSAYNSPAWNDDTAMLWSCDVPYVDPGIGVFDLCDGMLNPDNTLVVIVRVQIDTPQGEGEEEGESEGEGEGEGEEETDLPYDETNENGETEVFEWAGYYNELTAAQVELLSARWYYPEFELFGYRIYYFNRDSSGRQGFLSRHVLPTYTWNWVTSGEEYIEIDCGDESIFETLHLLEQQDRYYTSCLGDVSHLIERSGAIDVNTPGEYRRLYTRPGIDLWLADRWGQIWKRTIVVKDAMPEIVLLDEAGQPLVADEEEEAVTQIRLCDFATASAAEIEAYFADWWAITPMTGFYVLDACDDEALLTNRTVVWGDGLIADALKTFAADNTANISRNWLLTYSTRDSLNNNTNAQRKVVFVEDYALDLFDGFGNPLLPDLADEIHVTLECGDEFVTPDITVESVCTARPPEVSVAIQAYDEFGTPLDAVDVNTPGNYTVVYTVTDNYDNDTVATVYVEVVDTSAPVLALGAFDEEQLDTDGFLLLECGTTMTEPAEFMAADACDVNLGVVQTMLDEEESGVMAYAWALDGDMEPLWNEAVPVSLAYDAFVYMPGDYLLVYVAVDSSGNMYPALDGDGIPPIFDIDGNGNFLNDEGELVVDFARLVRVVDTGVPVITLNGEDAVEVNCNEAFEDLGAIAADDCDGELAVVVTGEVLTDAPGEYYLVYNATDSAGNVAVTVMRTVTVLDNCPVEGEGEGEPVEGEGEPVEGEGEPVEGEGEPVEGEGEPVEGEGELVEGEGEVVEGEGEPVEGEGEPVEGEGEPVEGEGEPDIQGDLFDGLDTDDDGRLTYDEAQTIIPGLTQEQFVALDTNKDGLLDACELGGTATIVIADSEVIVVCDDFDAAHRAVADAFHGVTATCADAQITVAMIVARDHNGKPVVYPLDAIAAKIPGFGEYDRSIEKTRGLFHQYFLFQAGEFVLTYATDDGAVAEQTIVIVNECRGCLGCYSCDSCAGCRPIPDNVMDLKQFMSDWLLIGLSVLVMLSWSVTRKH